MIYDLGNLTHDQSIFKKARSMKMIGSLFYSLLVLPGLLQLFTFFILLGLFALTKKCSGHKVAASLVAMGLLLALVAGFSPYWILTHLLIAGIGFVVWKKNTKIQMLGLPLTIAVYGLCWSEMADVKSIFPSTAKWQIGERGTPGSGNPIERLVELKFGVNFDQIEGRYSDRLADYLLEKQVSHVPIRIPIYYSWGVARGMGTIQVDDQEFPTTSGGYGSWSADRAQAPFPKYYFGLKSFSPSN